MALTTVADEVYRDYSLDGVPASGVHDPKKADIRRLLGGYERVIDAFTSAGGLIYDTRALLSADLAKAVNSMAWVVADPVAAYNGIYKKVGPSGTGSWVRAADLPYSFVAMADTGAGPPNALQVTSSIPTSPSVIRISNVFEANSGNVTISENGATPRALLTASGNQIAPDGLVAGMLIAYVESGASFRLLSDQASAAIQAAAEAAAIAAADYAALARNDVVVNTFVGDGVTLDWPLTVDPGTANNMRVNISGVSQLRTSYSLVHVSSVPTLRMTEAIGDGIPFEVEMGFRIAVGTPATGSVTYDKMQNVTSALRLLGRKAGGAGVVQEITPDELRDLFLPVGAVVQTVEATPYVANANLTTVVPLDDTVPQSTEGTQILTATITPRSATSKIRARWRGYGTIQTAPGTWIWAIFNGGANAIQAGHQTVPTADYSFPALGEVTYSPGSVSPQTISVRVGPITGAGNLRMNGNTAGRLLGGAAQCTLILEEIKA